MYWKNLFVMVLEAFHLVQLQMQKRRTVKQTSHVNISIIGYMSDKVTRK